MPNMLSIAQAVLSVIIIVCVLLQSQSGGFGANWKGGGETYHTKRGAEKALFYFTIISIALFAVVSIATLLS